MKPQDALNSDVDVAMAATWLRDPETLMVVAQTLKELQAHPGWPYLQGLRKLSEAYGRDRLERGPLPDVAFWRGYLKGLRDLVEAADKTIEQGNKAAEDAKAKTDPGGDKGKTRSGSKSPIPTIPKTGGGNFA